MKLYEVKARNGQVIEHSLTAAESIYCIMSLQDRHPEDHFTPHAYEAGEYTKDNEVIAACR